VLTNEAFDALYQILRVTSSYETAGKHTSNWLIKCIKTSLQEAPALNLFQEIGYTSQSFPCCLQYMRKIAGAIEPAPLRFRYRRYAVYLHFKQLCLKRHSYSKHLQCIFTVARMSTRTSCFQQLKHTPNFPVCCAFVSRCLVALRIMKIPLLLHCLRVASFLASIWSTLCNLCAGRKGIAAFYSSVNVSYQSVSTETWLLNRCVAADGS
jgi:hypothetical protein